MSARARTISWDAFLQVRELDRRAALGAASALAAGERDAARSLLNTWRFADDTTLVDALLQDLVEHPPTPSEGELGARLAPGDQLPRNGRMLTDWQHRHWLADQSIPARAGSDPVTRLAWGLVELRAIGRDIQERSRAPWLRQPIVPDPRDAAMPALWRALTSEDRWSGLARWHELFAPTALSAVRGVLDASGWPRADWGARIAYEEDNFDLRLMRPALDAGWRTLAVRVIETGSATPLPALAACLDEPAWSQVARCAVRRGHGWETATKLWPEVHRARVLAERMGSAAAASPGRLEAMAELHLATRLVRRWSRGEHLAPGESWRVVTQNLGRARGRLRAVTRRLSDRAIRAAVLSCDCLYTRTRLAVMRMWRDIAWTELRSGWAGNVGLEVEADCEIERVERAVAGSESLLRTWVLLVVLRGLLDHLRRWAATGAIGGRDGSWYRALSSDMPPILREGPDRMAGLAALRERLLRRLPHLLRELRPTLRAVAALDPGTPRVGAALHEVLRPVWDDGMALPAARPRQIIAHAAAALRSLDAEEAGP